MDYLTAGLEQAALGAYAPHLHEDLLGHWGLILLDGLDDIHEADTRCGQVKQAVLDFVTSLSRCRFLAPSRTCAYQKQAWQQDGF